MRGITSLPAYIFCMIVFFACSSEEAKPKVDCALVNIQVTVDEVTPVSDCKLKDGALMASAQGGEGDIAFSTNGVDFQPSGNFSGLGAGNYIITARDINGCEGTAAVSIGVLGSDLAITNMVSTPSGCLSSEAQLTIEATGQGALVYSLNNSSFQSSNVFSGLAAGTYVIVVRDEGGCEVAAQEKVLSGISYSQQVKEIILSNCAVSGCHDGSQGQGLDWTIFSNVQSNAKDIKTRTQNGDMPPQESGLSLTQQQKDVIACWIDDGAINN